jgi:transcriptional regulator with XRE-family HTH domain
MMTDVPELVAALKQRRLDLGLTQREVGDRSGIGQNLICTYERGRTISPTLAKIVAWADVLGCDVAIAARPAPPLRGHFDSLEDFQQDLRDNAWARRVAAPATPDDLDEIRRRLAERETEKENGNA